MKLSELIARLQYALASVETGDIDVKFNNGKNDFDLDGVDLAQEWTDYHCPKCCTELDYQYIRLTGVKTKRKNHAK